MLLGFGIISSSVSCQSLHEISLRDRVASHLDHLQEQMMQASSSDEAIHPALAACTSLDSVELYDVDLDGGVATGVDDLPADDVRDGRHGAGGSRCGRGRGLAGEVGSGARGDHFFSIVLCIAAVAEVRACCSKALGHESIALPNGNGLSSSALHLSSGRNRKPKSNLIDSNAPSTSNTGAQRAIIRRCCK